MRWLVLGAMLLCLTPGAPLAAEPACEDLPPCHGCGCRGGPGYRAPDNHCVSYREVDRVCGIPAELRCKAEKAPNYDLNRPCYYKPGKTSRRKSLSWLPPSIAPTRVEPG